MAAGRDEFSIVSAAGSSDHFREDFLLRFVIVFVDFRFRRSEFGFESGPFRFFPPNFRCNEWFGGICWAGGSFQWRMFVKESGKCVRKLVNIRIQGSRRGGVEH